LLVFAFQPYNVWPLAFFAFVPTFLAEYHFLPRRWSGWGAAISVGGWLAIFLTAAFGGGKYTWVFLAIAMLVVVSAVAVAGWGVARTVLTLHSGRTQPKAWPGVHQRVQA
jgi:hypothetical protein